MVDTAKITLTAGKGGDGVVSFHREKYVTAGGPDGGDGGKGGDILFVADPHMRSLMDFRYKKKFSAENGANGQGKNCFGRDGKDLIIKVPVGTLIKDAATNRIIFDVQEDTTCCVCKGGRGGWGNKHFASPTRQAPRFAKSGLDGECREILLEIKLLADVGLIGFPNVGKSTLLSVISAAKPQIANYHFTTLSPNLGVVKVGDDGTFICADLPGLIEGAADGAGLGHDFLRHTERCRLLLHVLDVSQTDGRDVFEDYEIINQELAKYSSKLAQLPQIVVANKVDILQDDEIIDKLKEYVKPNLFFAISGATTEGVKPLVYETYKLLQTLQPVEIFAPEIDNLKHFEPSVMETKVYRKAGVWVVEGDWLIKLMKDINFTDYESRAYFEKRLVANGVYKELKKVGIEDGDTVKIYNMEFDYIP